MTEHPLNQHSLEKELRRLGENLAAALRLARSHPDLIEVGEQISGGLANLAGAFEDEAGSAGVSAAAQRQELESQYMKGSGTARQEDTRFETELSSALRAANASLEEWIDRWSGNQAGAGGERLPAPDQRQEGHQEVHPDDVSSPPRETGHEEVHPDDVDSGETTVDLGK